MDEHQKKLLTIAIPTFDRNEILRKNIEKILPQMEDWAELLVVDNNSKIPVIETLNELTSTYRHITIRIFQNVANVGANANVLRCIEYCETEYIWILGDDDFPIAGALSKIYKQILDKDAIWINFHESFSVHQPLRNREYASQNLEGFLKELISISELVFVSNNIYKTSCIKGGLEIGNFYQSMMAPHLISMIAGVERFPPIGTYRISQDQLFESISNNKDDETAWPLYKAYVGIMSLHQVPFTRTVSRQINRLIQGARRQWLGNKSLIVAFSNLSRENGIRVSLRTTATFSISLLMVDRLRFVFSFPLYLAAILFAHPIHYVLRLRSVRRQNKGNI